ncbi:MULTISPECIES: FliC/FljB family flagellin [Variovorax]|jgi:flagellin|uniref:FliC/FljB family flagellin n=1 Tax=Variovorax TaxID=34072 RepID=UPI000868D9F7|nr:MULTISPECIES: FliC/FljB family flagellin [Variovorax]MBN8757153.1 FliC/FljB family flagellin [Variovorax sp.]ODU17889.1 MAG: flagellin [Variovorax sp. SCN 67-85]ODV24424.1 MAG: flagellin [Variovorax sp. SCN 67-20]OJZ13638.1 MAG: flagellin [Variovorax sp. 67-131]UKI06293.1 FliC/FljB family flagellin [Variovorax paradoxus]
MAQVINTNSLSLLTQNNLNKSQAALNSAIGRLSSGMRINSAKDDAAGQAIANRFTANIKGLTQATRNANDGISIAQTTEGALTEVNNNLQRIRELSVQAGTGTNSATDLDSIQGEITQRLDEINRVSNQTQFNGVKVLSANAGKLTVQVGANDGETIDIDLQEISAKTLGLDGFNVNGKGVSANTKANVNDLTKAGATGTGPYTVTTSFAKVTAEQAVDAMQDGNTAVVGATTYKYDATAGNFTTTATVATGGPTTAFAATLLPTAGNKFTGTFTGASGSTNFEVDSAGAITIGGQAAYISGGNLTTNNVGAPPAATAATLFGGADTGTGASSIKLNGTTYNFAAGANSGFTYTKTVSKDDVKTAVAGAASTVNLGQGIFASTVTFAAAGGQSSDTYMDNDKEMTKTASYTTDYAVNAVNGEVTVASTTGTGKYAAQVGATAYINSAGKLTTDTTSKGTKTTDPLAALDAALAKVDTLRGSLGAVQNRFDSVIANLGTTVTNLSSSRSRIEDADYAVEVSNMTRAQILQQAGTSVLSQANQTTQGVLSLLR